VFQVVQLQQALHSAKQQLQHKVAEGDEMMETANKALDKLDEMVGALLDRFAALGLIRHLAAVATQLLRCLAVPALLCEQ
jgi:hypothetical protein